MKWPQFLNIGNKFNCLFCLCRPNMSLVFQLAFQHEYVEAVMPNTGGRSHVVQNAFDTFKPSAIPKYLQETQGL